MNALDAASAAVAAMQDDAKTFYGYLTASLGRPDQEVAVKQFIWRAVKAGYRPALLPPTGTYHADEPKEADDAG